jgi:hypothetical protein
MDRKQAVRRQEPLPKIQRRLSQRILSRSVQLFRRYPLLFVLAVWVIFLMLAGLAVATMMNLDSSRQSGSASLSPLTSAPVPAPSDTVPPPIAASPIAPLPSSNGSASAKPQGRGLPLLALMAIALTCATGCIVFLQCLQPRRPSKRLQSLGSRSASRSAESSQSRRINPEGSKLQADLTKSSLEPSSRPVDANLVPQEVSQPLDWEEPSLADSLDLRQRQPLSHWL